MQRIALSQEERDKLEWLKRAEDKVISQREAAEKIGVSERWVRKLLKRMKKHGDAVAVHGLRGRSSNRKIAAQTQRRTIELLKQPDWHDFGPTFASQQPAKRHGIEVSDETVRQASAESNEHTLGGLAAALLGNYLVRLIDDATSWSWGIRNRSGFPVSDIGLQPAESPSKGGPASCCPASCDASLTKVGSIKRPITRDQRRSIYNVDGCREIQLAENTSAPAEVHPLCTL